MTDDTKLSTPGLILPATSQLGNPSENTLAVAVPELERSKPSPGVALDGGFHLAPPTTAAADLTPIRYPAGE